MPDRALLLGVNEYRFVSPLRGCVNDVRTLHDTLTGVFGFSPNAIRSHIDNEVTKDVVRDGMRWLLDGAAPGDRLVFHFSGHGSFVPDRNGDETRDEIICLVDMDFSNPDSYFLDDELAAFAARVPEAAQLVFILDSCHSGTGTRGLMLPGEDGGNSKGMTLLDSRVTSRLAGVDLTAPDYPPSPSGATDNLVRVRFISPPARVWEAVSRSGGNSPRRDAATLPGREVLLAACRDDQTAADALIDGVPQGAFSHHLARVLRESGPAIGVRELMSRVEAGLRSGQFEQVPQVEARDLQRPLFHHPALPGPTCVAPPDSTPPEPRDGSVLRALTVALESLESLSPVDRSRALRVAEELLERRRRPEDRAPSARRRLVAVHGICRHTAGFSDPWWASLQPFTEVFGPGRLGQERIEVTWSDLVNPRTLDASRGVTRGVEQEVVADLLRSALMERAEMMVGDETSARDARDLVRDPFAADRALNIPLLSCVDDFAVYLTNNAKRAEIIARFTGNVRPLLEAGEELDIIAHSWGTVVAYEGLRELDALQLSGRVRHFFTAGSALAIGVVKARLRASNRDGRKPAGVSEWCNLDARGDVVGGRLKGRPFAVDQEFLDIPPQGCGLLDLGCAHGSYFDPRNLAVNRDIFARFINQP